MKKKQFENGQPCTIDGVTCRYSDLIWQERNTCAYNERGRYPDNVMIHPAHKNNVYGEAESITAYTTYRGRMTHYFGMKVIWTDDIGEDEVICTYNGR